MSSRTPAFGVLDRVVDAQRHAGSFGGDELARLAMDAAALSAALGWHLLASGQSGERIVAAASLDHRALLADASRRLDGLVVLLVAGLLAGPYELARDAAVARSLGATAVHAAFIGGWDCPIPGCDSTRTFSTVHTESRIPVTA